MLAIPIVNEIAGASVAGSSYFAQPIDAILFDVFIWTAWIPIATTLAWGFSQMWLNSRYGLYSARLKHVVLAIDVPSMTEQSPKALENLFATLYGAKSSITWKEKWIYGKFHPTFGFEIVSTEGYIQFLVRTQPRFRDVVEAGIYAHYPDAEIFEVEDYVTQFPNEFPDEEYEMWGGELMLDKHYMFPIRTYVDFEDRLTQEIKDPLGYMLEQMGKMKPGEHFWFQMLVRPDSNSWIEPGLKHVRGIYGDVDAPKKSALFGALQGVLSWPAGVLEEATGIDANSILFGAEGDVEEDQWKVFKITLQQKDEAEAILQKTTKVGHGVKIRILYVAKKNSFVKVERTAMIKGMLNQYANLNLNRFGLYIPSVPKDDYFWMRWSYTSRQRKLMAAYKGRSWGIGATPFYLNTEELATLWHFPTIAIKAPLIKKSESKRAEPPVGLPVTFNENILPDYATPLGTGAHPEEGMEDVPLAGLPMYVSDEPLPETLPRPVAPTGTQPDVEPFVAPEQSVPSAPAVIASAPGMRIIDPENLASLAPPDAADQAMDAPIIATAPTESPQDDDFVPPNLPV